MDFLGCLIFRLHDSVYTVLPIVELAQMHDDRFNYEVSLRRFNVLGGFHWGQTGPLVTCCLGSLRRL